MDKGILVEDGVPADLFKNSKSAFAQMISDSEDAASLIEVVQK